MEGLRKPRKPQSGQPASNPEPPEYEVAGPYDPLGTTGTVPRAYEGMEEETIKINKSKIQKCNKPFKLKKKFHYKPTCGVRCV
jgi:hypothetical protein